MDEFPVGVRPVLAEKYKVLLSIISESGGGLGGGGVAVAFSGGADSSFLCRAAKDSLGEKALAVTVDNPMLPRAELESAKAIAAEIGINHVIVLESEIDEQVAANPKERCYFCKKGEFAAIRRCALERGIETVLDGTNTDDEGDWRPGIRALAELGVFSPLRAAGFSKADIRELSRAFGMATWNKPAAACLASRIPYGERIDAKKLARVEAAETAMREAGFRQFRVRCHGDTARLEVAPEERRRFFDEHFLDSLSAKIKGAGFLYAAFELEGYKMGSLNRTFLV